MKRNITKKIKKNRIYSFKEISNLFNIHIRTVQEWRKRGMKVIDEYSKPYLVEGVILREFLKQKSAKRKCPLKDGEFYCTKCGTNRKSIGNKIHYNFTQKLIGKNQKQVIIKGVCVVCGCRLNLFSTEKKLNDLTGRGIFSPEFGQKFTYKMKGPGWIEHSAVTNIRQEQIIQDHIAKITDNEEESRAGNSIN